MARVVGIDHLVIRVRDFERSREFYDTVLGFLEFKRKYNFDKIIMKFVKEENVALTMLEKGELDFDGLTPEAYMKKTEGKEWGTRVLKFKVENKAPKGYGFIGWNLRQPLFQARNVRLALAHLLNRDLMNDKFHFGMSLLAAGPWHQYSAYADPTVKPLLHDPAQALELLGRMAAGDFGFDGAPDAKAALGRMSK